MRKPSGNRWRPRFRALGWVVVGFVLGGVTVALARPPWPARPTEAQLLEQAIARYKAIDRPSVAEPYGFQEGDSASAEFTPGFVGPTDRCLVRPPQVDERFVKAAPVVDRRMAVEPGVRGLPFGPRQADAWSSASPGVILQQPGSPAPGPQGR